MMEISAYVFPAGYSLVKERVKENEKCRKKKSEQRQVSCLPNVASQEEPGMNPRIPEGA